MEAWVATEDPGVSLAALKDLAAGEGAAELAARLFSRGQRSTCLVESWLFRQREEMVVKVAPEERAHWPVRLGRAGAEVT